VRGARILRHRGVLAGVACALALSTIIAPAAGAGGGLCPVAALKKSQEVELTFWYVMQRSNEEALLALIDQFESEHPNISVDAINQTSYEDSLNKYVAGLSTGDLPDLAQFEETTVQQLIDSRSTVPISACTKADDYSTEDFLERPIEYYTTRGVLHSMPWVLSNPVLIFNRGMIEQAGIDPDEAPATFDELREYAKKVADSGAARHGMALHVEPFLNEFLFAKSGLEYVNNGNGRKGRATEAVFDGKGGLEIWSWWNDMVQSGLAVNTGATPQTIDHLLALGNGDAAMTFEASGALGPIEAVLQSGEFAGTQVGVWPLPALRPGGGVPVGDGSLWIPKAGSPAEKAAAWELTKFFVAPENVATMAVASQGGYIPIRRTAAEDHAVTELWAQKPWLKVPYDQMSSGPDNATTSGSVIGDYQGVRNAVREGFLRMLTGRQSPKQALRQAERDATAAIEEYNSRIGA